MRISILSVFVAVLAACGPEDGHPGLLSSCDPLQVQTACVSGDSVGACTVENGSYKLVFQARCGADELGIDIAASAGSLASRCEDGTDAGTGLAKASCVCVPGATAETCSADGTVLSAFECGADGTFVRSRSDHRCPAGGTCQCDATACACSAPDCPATANDACRTVLLAECAWLQKCHPSMAGGCAGIVGVSGKGDEAPGDTDCDRVFSCLEGLDTTACDQVFPIVCGEAVSADGLDCQTGATT